MNRRHWGLPAGLILLALVILLLPLAAVAGGDAIVGTWEVADGSGRIEIFHCGGKYCGRIAWLQEPVYGPGDPGGMAGKPLVDRENPRPELRSRPQLGLQIMEGYTFRGNDFWDDGSIYNTENGRTYRSTIALLASDRLKLRGFIGIPLLGGSTVWKRYR